MIGAIIGDIVGSTYEFVPIKTKNFVLFPKNSVYTDDSVMTIAVARALMEYVEDNDSVLSDLFIKNMRQLGLQYPKAGYGTGFGNWLRVEYPEPYNSYGNGAAMRVSPCGFAAKTLDEALRYAEESAAISHNHPEGIKGAQAVAAVIYLAKTGASKDEIGGYICDYFYLLTETLDEIRPNYFFNETCQGTVPQAIVAFLESDSYEDAIRNAVSLGGDADTLAAITGGMAWAYYTAQNGGHPTEEMSRLAEKAYGYMPQEFVKSIEDFNSMFV